MVADKLGDRLNTEAERRALGRALAEAVARAEGAFVAEHGPHAPELVAALTRDTRFADLPSVRAALRDLLAQPFHDPSGSVAVLQRSFADVLPATVDRTRVDAVVRAFLAALGRNDSTLWFERIRGISNVITQSPAHIRLREGMLLVVHAFPPQKR